MQSAYAEYYLAHHGRPGQKWGKRNGPPYPLDYKDLSDEEKKVAKESAIQRGDIEEANKNKEYFTNKELEDVIRRFDLNQKVSSLDKSKIEKGMARAQKLAGYAGTVADFTTKTSNAYNSIAKVINTFSNEELPIIGESRKTDKQYDSKTIEKMLKNPDKYSREDWQNVAALTNNIKNSKSNYENYSKSLTKEANKVAREQANANNTKEKTQPETNSKDASKTENKNDPKKKKVYTGPHYS